MAILYFIRLKVLYLFYPISLASTSCGLWDSLVQQEQSTVMGTSCTGSPRCAPKPLALPLLIQSLCPALRPRDPPENNTRMVSQTPCNPKPATCAPQCRQGPLKQGRDRDFGASPKLQGFPSPPPLLQFPSQSLAGCNGGEHSEAGSKGWGELLSCPLPVM